MLSIAKGTVERGGKFGGVGHDEGVRMACCIQCLSDGHDLPIHHCRGGNHIRAGGGHGTGDFLENGDRCIIIHIARAIQGATVAMIGVGANAYVGNYNELRKGFFNGSNGFLNGSIGCIGSISVRIFFISVG